MQPLVRPLTPFSEGASSASASGGPIVENAEEKANELDVEEESTEEDCRADPALLGVGVTVGVGPIA